MKKIHLPAFVAMVQRDFPQANYAALSNGQYMTAEMQIREDLQKMNARNTLGINMAEFMGIKLFQHPLLRDDEYALLDDIGKFVAYGKLGLEETTNIEFGTPEKVFLNPLPNTNTKE